jgi:hypothetical protein
MAGAWAQAEAAQSSKLASKGMTKAARIYPSLILILEEPSVAAA